MKEIKALTSLRGIAAMMVVMQHFSSTMAGHATVNIPSLVPHGYMAVDLFFVLSGFIMAYTYQADFALRGALAMPSFLLKRAARILPLNTVVVLSIAAAGAISSLMLGRNIFYSSSGVAFDVVCNLLLLQGLGIGMNLNGPSWSICTEFVAYLLFPLLLALSFSRRAVINMAVLTIAIGGLFVTALVHPRFGLDVSSIPGELVLCFTQFVLGLFTYRVTRIAAVRYWLLGDRPAVLAAAWVAGSLLVRVDILAALGFPAVVATLACNKGRVADLMATPVPYFLGEVSFSIYLIHDPCRPVAAELLRAVHPEPLGAVGALGCALGFSLLVVPVAWIAYLAIERPGRRAVRGLAALIVRPST